MSYLDLARGRYSCREFEDRAVEQAVVDAIVEAGRIAPSACNNHPTRVMVLDTPELLEKAAACQPRFARDGSIFGAPLIFLICSVTDDAWVRPYDQMNSSAIDTSIVCDQMMMEATEHGLGTCGYAILSPRWHKSSSICPRASIPIICSSVAIPPTTSPIPSIARPEPFPSPTSFSSRFLGHALKPTLDRSPVRRVLRHYVQGSGFLCCAPRHSHKKGPASCGSFLGTKL